MQVPRSLSRATILLNPLPSALKHYEAALTATLASDLSIRAIRVSIESPSDTPAVRRVATKLLAAARLILSAIGCHTTVVLWPTFGLAEPFLWRAVPGMGRRFILIHDPVPLRRQVGFSGLAARMGRWGSRGKRITVVAHTDLAADVLRSRGFTVGAVVGHPVMSRSISRRVGAGTKTALVAGQYKTARDLDLLRGLCERLGDSWKLQVKGRGWPALDGWEVDSRFLTEHELHVAISAAAVVVLPYKHYFQSGIATRAFELGVPVAAERHEFVESLFGSDWPGLVKAPGAEGWCDAINAAAKAQPGSGAKYMAKNRLEWLHILARTNSAEEHDGTYPTKDGDYE